MLALEAVGRASSPDALLSEVLAGRDEPRLAALATVLGVDMLADYVLLLQVERRRREILPPTAGEAEAAGADFRLAEALKLKLPATSDEEDEEMERLYRRALAVQRRVLDERDATTLRTLRQLGQMLKQLRRYDEAEPLLREALEKQEEHLGPEDVDTLQTMDYLADLLKDTDRKQEAEGLYRKALEGRRREQRTGSS